ncbi:MAG TPA: bifunctional [glutamine synthetase] adenylyltransferase/[glutamine synthetase]-adenylyl-L-tyrosine phosphorylase [Acidimicrobiales bacterium]|nr:bifunctional [glutamine synthetase] adenylyltransferase/[glutamine synthetase]-adenylyl-L-tyrosine phosphorylase [Acidimicrobiales bacterium]
MDRLRDVIERSAAPAAVEVALTRLEETYPGFAERMEDDGRFRAAVVAVTAASRSLTRHLLTDRAALDVVADLDHRPHAEAADAEGLLGWKRRELLRIAARDLLGLDDLVAVGAALAALGDDVLTTARRLAGPAAAGLVVVGMGKLGARELNYASDIDVLFVGEGDARPVMEVARSCFRVDANLRPEGRDGALVRSLAAYEAYWDRWAQAWEFQALLKARPVDGPDDLARDFARAAAERVWGRPFGAEDIREVRGMKARAEQQVARRGLSDREVKLGPGGIRDIEFAVQLLQLVHGRHDLALRVPATLPALGELAGAGYVDPDDGRALAEAYRFLRATEHRLQLVDEQQVHALPTDAVARERLARTLGFRDAPERTALGQLDDALRRSRGEARAIHERLYFRPLLEAFAGAPGAMTEAAADARLAAFGFADADRTRQALRELTRGLTRSSRLMQQLLPLLLQWLADAPDPDLGLLGLRSLVSGAHRGPRVVEAFRESPELARRLCLLLGTSRLLQRGLEQQPELLRMVGDDDALRSRTADELLDRVRSSLDWRGSADDRRAALRRLVETERLRTAAADVLGLADTRTTGAALTRLAEAVLDAALDVVGGDVPLAIIGMGRFGGGELSYASDLDVLVVHGATDPGAIAAAEAATEDLLRFVNGTTPAVRLFEIDAALRPEGRQGALARSLDSYAAYYARWAQTWERQALVRARTVAGDQALGARFLDTIASFVWAPLGDDEVREIRRMKARIERERIPAGDDPQFHLKLGRGSLSDIEWTVQLLQLRHGVRAPSTDAAITALHEAAILTTDDAQVLRESYRFCERTRNRWFLVKGSPGDSLPQQATQLARLARSLDVRPSDLREQYRRVTRRARAVVERLFYGHDPAR